VPVAGGIRIRVMAVTSRPFAHLYAVSTRRWQLRLRQTEEMTMKTTRKLAIAAAAVAALATASIATSGDAFARGGHGHGGGMRAFGGGGGGKFIGGRHFGHHWRFRGYGYAYNTCWKWTPYGLVNVCRVLPY
jgi:hypothetical protein